jgi:hypothetical protein
MVAVFPKIVKPEQLSVIKDFFREAYKAQGYAILPEEPFPLVYEYMGKEVDLSGKVSFGTEDDLEHLILIRGTILAYSAEVSHLADWSLLAAFMKKKFGAKEVLIASEEDGSTNIVNHLILEFEAKELAKKYRKLHRQVANIKDDLQTLYNSCIEGQTGDWDCSTDEGRKGLDAMTWVVEKIAKTLNLKIGRQE